MYIELCTFIQKGFKAKTFFKDGDFLTSLVGGFAGYLWFSMDSEVIPKIRLHFGDFLSTSSILFGFAFAALLFYIQASESWSEDEKATKILNKIVDWHVWTIICLLALIAYILGLWSFGLYLDNQSKLGLSLYSFLVFLFLYCCFQILNHTLTVWWAFHSRKRLGRNPRQTREAQ
jgi:uncharacterized membrane protein YfcA